MSVPQLSGEGQAGASEGPGGGSSDTAARRGAESPNAAAPGSATAGAARLERDAQEARRDGGGRALNENADEQ